MRSVAEIFSSHEELDASGRHVNGTDKHGPNHRYGDAYEAILSVPEMYEVEGLPLPGLHARSIRGDVGLMMEVGVADGSSLLGWREVFPNAHCVGMDIHPAHRLMGCGLDRLEFHLGNMAVLDDCRRATAGRQFDVIVEDATHYLTDTLQTLLYLWPSVRPGGVYIVEEFANVGALRDNIASLWPHAEIVGTCGPRGEDEPLVVFRKPL